MPALLPVPGVMRFAVNGSCNGASWTNVFHATDSSGTPWSQGDANAATLGMRNAYKSAILGFLSHDGSLGTVIGQDLSDDLGVTASATGSDLGGDFQPAMPANVAMCVTWLIPRHYRGGHPRTYLPMIPGPYAANAKNWTTTAANGAHSAATAFLTAVGGITAGSRAPLQLCCVHYTRHKVALNPPLVDIIAGASVDTRIDTQRRRLGKHP